MTLIIYDFIELSVLTISIRVICVPFLVTEIVTVF
ncbi:hypothetical protein B0F87_107312 [Methylobacter tundripaludum]|uniref:Uncharacterized protein n=1 Tax=Methylobacter tundripaludum TaxID=173365 RepID=A0A2S6HC85_9GAMM|nr:hypothetical protein B0F87_107312 [Methylobacter tundripaludum]